MAHKFGLNIHYFLVFMVLVACASQAGNQEGMDDSLDSANGTEVCIVPQHSYNDMAADFGMNYFSIQSDADSVIPALKQRKENQNVVFSSLLPLLPAWMSEVYAADSLYRNAYCKYVKCYLDEYHRRGLPIQTLYIQKNSRESRFVTIEELSAVVKCQLRLVDELPESVAQRLAQ